MIPSLIKRRPAPLSGAASPDTVPAAAGLDDTRLAELARQAGEKA